MAKLEGVIVYTIEKDGCLNGVYANNSTPKPHEVFNEIAKLQSENQDKKSIVGNYLCSWSDTGSIISGELKIAHTKHFYQVDWYTGGKHEFTGKGFITGPHQFTVAYTTP